MNKLVTILVTATTISCGAASDALIDLHSQNRHSTNDRPLELDVDAISTYNDKSMALMMSPCRPESDGFFGATSGDPTKITYRFRLEAAPLAPIVKILDIVDDKVVDSILSQAFPQMCGLRRRHLDAHVASGFRFYKFQEIGKWNMPLLLLNCIFTDAVSASYVPCPTIRKMYFGRKPSQFLWDLYGTT